MKRTNADTVERVERERARDTERSARPRAVRARTLGPRALRRLVRDEGGRILLPVLDEYDRPQTRAECETLPRPCPFVGCRHHLYLDVDADTGAIKLNFPDLDVGEMIATCALDVATRGARTGQRVGELMNLTRERVRQVENTAIAAIGPRLRARGLAP